MSFRERLAQVEDRIAAACRQAGRVRNDVRLMAVSKTHPAGAILEAVDAGLMLFGENRVQEFDAKRATLPMGLDVHLIGHLQSNKAAKAAAIFSGVDSVDSLHLFERLNAAVQQSKQQLPVLLEIKLSGEAAKTGFDPASAELRQTLEHAEGRDSIAVHGLMTVAPLSDDPEIARRCFRRLRELRDELAHRHPRLDLHELSMGMSGDFEIAIKEGSTLVRIGSALFGARPPVKEQ